MQRSGRFHCDSRSIHTRLFWPFPCHSCTVARVSAHRIASCSRATVMSDSKTATLQLDSITPSGEWRSHVQAFFLAAAFGMPLIFCTFLRSNTNKMVIKSLANTKIFAFTLQFLLFFLPLGKWEPENDSDQCVCVCVFVWKVIKALGPLDWLRLHVRGRGTRGWRTQSSSKSKIFPDSYNSLW